MTNLEEQDWSGLSRMIRQLRVLVNGDLDPNNYGQLVVQDAYYCFNGQNDYVTGATCADNDDWKVFYNKKADKYAEYNNTYHDNWHIHDIESVTPGDAIKEYAQYLVLLCFHASIFGTGLPILSMDIPP